MKVISIVSTLLLIAQMVCAQRYQLTDSVEIYGDDVKRLLTKTNDSTAIKIGEQFAGLWQELSASQRDTIMATSSQMLSKSFPLSPSFVNYYAVINVAVDSAKISKENLNGFLSMLLQTCKYYDRKEFGHTVTTLRDFFQRQAVYYANYNRLYARNGKYSFSFIAPPKNIEVPEVNLSSNGDISGWDEDDGWGDGAWGNPESSDEWENAEKDSGWNEGWGWEEDSTEEVKQEDEKVQISEYIVEETVQPELVGPIMHLESVDLTFVTTFDSANLVKTKADLMLCRHIMVGVGGKFDWVTAGLSADSVFYTFDKYNFDTRVPRLSAENGHMTYVGKVKNPVKGAFQFASQKHAGFKSARYPRFMSYNSDINVDIYNKKSVNENVVSYKGGFSLQGSKITSASMMEGEAVIEVHGGGKKKFRAISKKFNVGDSLLSSPQSTITIYQRTDSIYHPAIELKYAMDSSQLILLSANGKYKHTPFTSTHLRMDIQADIIRWDLRTDSLNISTLTARDKVPVIFESHEYFNEAAFDQLSQMYGFHPLIMAVGYGRKNNTLSFYTYDMARDVGQNEKTLKVAMMDLMTRGYIDYEPATGLVTLKKKGIHYTLAKARRVDYDNLMMPSIEDDGPNATIKLDSKELVMRGIQQFNISEDLGVSIEPTNNEVTMLGERNFRFNGKLQSGNFEFVGEGFTFNYDSFKMELPKIDSISFYLPTEKGNRKKVDNTLQSATQDESFIEKMGDGFKQTSGTLYINDPKNKSARKSLPDYPKFNAENGAIVYFDNKNILDGAYDKSMYFVIPPFAIDSLSNADPSSIGFAGTLYSDILPPIDETLKVMSDNSMGFEHKVNGNGYQLYKGSGVYKNRLRLDAKGLRGNGTIDFLTSTLESEEFIFYMDSVTTIGTAAEIREGTLGNTSFPQAYVENYTMLWLPQVDSMYISNNAEPFEFYNQTASLDGSAILTEKGGLLGSGTLFTRGSEATSEQMTFEQTRFDARHAAFEIKSDNPNKPALAGDDVFLDFDLDKNIANISPEEEGVAAIAFPYAQFKTSITNAVWNMEEETVKMSKPDDVEIENSYFYATRKELDSLWFNAEEAIYRIPLLQLDIFGVPFITTADAKVIPENNQLQVLENAKFETFQNATLIIDTLNEYHRLTNGTIDILSRHQFKGKAFYELIAATDTFSIEMNNFKKDTVQVRKQTFYHTVSNGKAEASQNIVISPGMLYRGNVRMHAAKEALELDGEVKLDFKRMPDYNTWIAYASDAGQKKLVFNFNEAVTSQGDPLTAGLHINSKDNSLYSTFVMNRRSPDDFDFFKPKGLLSFDEKKDEYTIRSPKKDVSGALAGEVFTYNENKQTVSFEGPVDFMPFKSPSFAIDAAAIGKGNLETKEFSLDALMAFQIDLPSQAIDIMGADLNESLNKSGAQSATNDRTTLLYKLAEVIGDQAARDWDKRSVSNYTPLVTMSSKLAKTLVFADVDMKWSDAHKAWYSTSPLGLSNVREQDVNGSMTGFLEIKPLEMEGMMVNLFMQATPDSWYFFSYQNNRLAVWAYSEEFCDVVGSKSRIGKVDGGQYAYFLSDIAETLKYINRFRKDYLGIEEQYNFNTAAPVIAGEDTEEKKPEADRDGF